MVRSVKNPHSLENVTVTRPEIDSIQEILSGYLLGSISLSRCAVKVFELQSISTEDVSKLEALKDLLHVRKLEYTAKIDFKTEEQKMHEKILKDLEADRYANRKKRKYTTSKLIALRAATQPKDKNNETAN